VLSTSESSARRARPATRPLVDFVIAGVQKGGTTALFYYLRKVPGIQMPVGKELHFFDNETDIDWSEPDYEQYHEHFVATGDACRGEATPIYIYWPNSLERLKRYNAGIKLIFLFRDPVERAWSGWKMEYARGAETEPFAWCIREGRARVTDHAAPGFHRVYSYVERGFYGEQIERVFRLFDRQQVLILRSDDLRDHPDATIRGVCRFLGVAEPAAPVFHRTVHPSQERDYGDTLTADDVGYLRDLYRRDLADFQQQTGITVARWSSERG
jgi:hypothetical protein